MAKFSLLAAIVLQLVVVSMQQDDDALSRSMPNIQIRVGGTSIARINDHIQKEYNAMYMYDAMASYFGRPSVGLPGFKKFFKKAADEEREHAHKLIEYLNKRGGHVTLKPISPEPITEWRTASTAVSRAFAAEKDITVNLYKLRDDADEEKDTQLVDFIESQFLTEQTDRIAELHKLIRKLDRAGSGLGEYIVDKELS